ncbi:HPP family protein [Streptomyces sp. NBC_01465]|uniref:HPP family protein n=1 Tax=Streptomyces sp. NBC_01465 TaxID=2903878 RepID=UPI002E30E4FD|nr:HPP family protein [Streptomyces sp. NBC_01465]
MPTRSLLIATASSVGALVLLVVVGVWWGQTLLIPPLAASMSLVTAASATPLGQPRNVIGGQLASAVTGFLVLYAGGANKWSAAVAGGLSVGVMLVLRMTHSPAAATAVIVALTDPAPAPFLGLLAVGSLLLVTVGVVAARAARQPYPVYWW